MLLSPNTPPVTRIRHGVCATILLLGPLLTAALHTTPARADKNLLVPATINGRQSSIYEKVVVVSSKAQLRPKPGGEGEFIEPFSIFFKLKADGGALETEGHIRVGDSQGNPLGWISSADLKPWNTRFVLEPLEPTADKTFSVELDSGTRANLRIVPAGKRRFAFITGASEAGGGSDENGPFPVIVCTAEIRTEGSRGFTDELNDLRNLKLEVVFVLESTDFMLNKYDGRPLTEYMIELAEQLATSVKGDAQLAKSQGVRFGIVEYQDTSKLAQYASRVRLKLTDNMDQFASSVRSIEPIAIQGDWPEDVVAGLNSALRDSGWIENSIKHIILIGQASMQLDPRGTGPNQFGGRWNSIVQSFDRDNPDADCGHNSTGLSIERLIQSANPEAGSADKKARDQKSFHALWIGTSVEDELRDVLKEANVDLDVRELVSLAEAAVRFNDQRLNALVDRFGEDILFTLLMIPLAKHQQTLAQTQYRQLVANRSRDGYYQEVPPNGAALKAAASDLTSKLRETVEATAKIRRGEIQDPSQLSTDNAILERYYTVVGASVDKFKDQEVLTGDAAIRDQRGRLVAQKKVLVTREELTRLKSTFDAIRVTFSKMTSKVDRQDVSSILDKLKRSVASTAAGQEIDAKTPLKEFLTDLPLKTNALDVSAGDIAVMSSDAFSQWLNKLEASLFRIQDLLDGKAEWNALNAKAENDKFTFLHLSELP
jgi:hypothetical protein